MILSVVLLWYYFYRESFQDEHLESFFCIYMCNNSQSHTFPTLFQIGKQYCHTKKERKCGDISWKIYENIVNKKEKEEIL